MFSRQVRLLALFSGLVGSMAAPAALAECLRYGAASVVIAGILEQNTYPNLSRGGGEADTDYYLRLRAAVCAVAGAAGGTDTEGRKGVWRVQLVLKPGAESLLGSRLGRSVNVRGRLFSSHSERHHAPLVLDVVGVEGEH